MNNTCRTCKGKGRWQVREVYSDGDELLVWQECGSCHGTGVSQAPEDTSDFDIDGEILGEDNE